MTEDQSSIEELKQKKQSLENEISSLESQLQISLEKEKLHQSTLTKIKKIQSEYEQSYLSSLNDYKNRENSLKSQYLNYQNLLEKQYNESERRLNDEISLLKNQLKQKDEIISTLQKQTNDLNNALSKGELDFHFKEKKLQDEILSKTRKIEELKENGNELAKEAQEEIGKLYIELENAHQQRQNINENNINNNNNNNINNINNNYNNHSFKGNPPSFNKINKTFHKKRNSYTHAMLNRENCYLRDYYNKQQKVKRNNNLDINRTKYLDSYNYKGINDKKLEEIFDKENIFKKIFSILDSENKGFIDIKNEETKKIPIQIIIIITPIFNNLNNNDTISLNEFINRGIKLFDNLSFKNKKIIFDYTNKL